MTLESIERRSSGVDETVGTTEWRVQTVREWTDWRDGAVACASCGRSVALDGPHVGAQLLRERPDATGERKRRHDHCRVAFCDRDCADAWLDRE